MKKIELKDVLHLYVGSKMVFFLDKKNVEVEIRAYHGKLGLFHAGNWYAPDTWKFKPLLRPISSLTDAEKCELYRIANDWDSMSTELERVYDTDQSIMAGVFTPAQFIYLLSLSIDMFGLLDSKQAEILQP